MLGMLNKLVCFGVKFPHVAQLDKISSTHYLSRSKKDDYCINWMSIRHSLTFELKEEIYVEQL